MSDILTNRAKNQKTKQNKINIEKHIHKYTEKNPQQNKEIHTHKIQRLRIVCDIHIICKNVCHANRMFAYIQSHTYMYAHIPTHTYMHTYIYTYT
jgi:hypothetical protein